MLNATQLKKTRAARGLSQEALAESAGISRATIAEAEAGRLLNPTLDTVKALARALDVPWLALLTDHEEAAR